MEIEKQPVQDQVAEKRSLKGTWITLGCLLILLIAVYVGGVVFFNSHYVFNTYINGINCTFLVPEQADEKISSQVESYQIEVVGRGGLIDYIKGSSVDLSYVPDGQTQNLLTKQNSLLWPFSLFNRPEAEHTEASVSLNSAKLSSAIRNLVFLDIEHVRPPLDAYLKFATSSYSIHPEEEGATVDEQKAHTALTDAMMSLASSVDLDLTDSYMHPELYSNSPAILQLLEDFNTYVPFSVTYTLGEKTMVLDGYTAIDWVTVGQTVPGELNYNAVAEWVDSFADSVDTLGSTRSIVSGYGETKTVTGGTYGWLIDRNAEIRAIQAACRANRAEVREPYYTSRAVTHDEQDWGDTYVEVDITRQHLWYYEGGKPVFDCDVVTGHKSYHPTPPGVYYVFDKKSPTVLVGQILASTGRPEYINPVTYWMQITVSGVGFHDATWQPWFGGDRYTFAGSHGCINMPYDYAKQLYSLIQIGCPAIIHD